MGTTRELLEVWFKEGVTRRATHMIVACDTFSHEDYPVYVLRGMDVRNEVAKYDGVNMQAVLEIYNLHSMTFEEQRDLGALVRNTQPYTGAAVVKPVATFKNVSTSISVTEPVEPVSFAIVVQQRLINIVEPAVIIWKASVVAPKSAWVETFGSEIEVKSFIRGVKAGAAALGRFDVIVTWE